MIKPTADHRPKTTVASLGNFKGPILRKLRCPLTARKVYRTRDDARADVFDYIERFYNPRRRHSTLAYISPVEFEERAMLA
jgi:transposase InsO family protein